MEHGRIYCIASPKPSNFLPGVGQRQGLLTTRSIFSQSDARLTVAVGGWGWGDNGKISLCDTQRKFWRESENDSRQPWDLLKQAEWQPKRKKTQLLILRGCWRDEMLQMKTLRWAPHWSHISVWQPSENWRTYSYGLSIYSQIWQSELLS
jgi:hypothetical protein